MVIFSPSLAPVRQHHNSTSDLQQSVQSTGNSVMDLQVMMVVCYRWELISYAARSVASFWDEKGNVDTISKQEILK